MEQTLLANSKGYVLGETTEEPALTFDGKNLAAVLLGRMGGLKGGRARAEKLTAEERHSIAKRAATVRWKGKSKNECG